MPVFLDTADTDFETAFATLLTAKREDSPDVDATVAGIIAEVRQQGDAAMIALTERFDRMKTSAERLRFSPAEIDAAVDTLKQLIDRFRRTSPTHRAVGGSTG